jgi:hypothetical protein
MAAGRIIFPGLMPAVDQNGDRIAGAKAYFYENETTTPANVFTASALAVAHANPVVADSVGVWPAIWADTAEEYTVALTDADGVPIAPPWDGVSASIDATLASAALAESAQAAAEAAQAAAEAAKAAAEAALAQTQAIVAEISGEPFGATSATPNAIGVGLKTFVLNESGKLYREGQTLVASVAGNADNQVTGICMRFDETTKEIDILVEAGGYAAPDGAGPYNSWSIALSGRAGVQSVAGLTGAITAAAVKGALALTSADLSDFNTAVDGRAVPLSALL